MTQPGFGEQLRILRDCADGFPARVNDTFIAETEKAIERYGQDAGERFPPPPAGAVDIASMSILVRLGLRQARVGRYGLDAFGRLDVPQDTSSVPAGTRRTARYPGKGDRPSSRPTCISTGSPECSRSSVRFPPVTTSGSC